MLAKFVKHLSYGLRPLSVKSYHRLGLVRTIHFTLARVGNYSIFATLAGID